MRASFLIDDNGCVHRANSMVLRQFGDGPLSGDSFAQYAVCNLGFVGGREHRNALQLFIRPASVTAEAFVQTAYMVRDLALDQRVVVSIWAHGGFVDQLFANGGVASEFLTSLVAFERQNSRARLKSREIMPADATAKLRQCLALLNSGSGATVERLNDKLVDVTDVCEGRYVTFERAPSCFILHGFGPNNPAHAMNWYQGNIGLPLRRGLDPEYSWFCNAAYRRALVKRRPLLEAVDVMVCLPGQQRMRRRYQRLIVPLGHATNPVVFIATIEDSSIKLLTA